MLTRARHLRLCFKALFFLLACGFSQPVFAQNGLSWSPSYAVAATNFGSASPRLALLPDGTPLVVWGNSATSQIWCARWDGSAFAAPVKINTGSIAPGLYDFAGLDVATAGQQVFVVFENFTQGIFLVRSEDGGQNWQPPVTVFVTPPGLGNTLPAVAIDPAGNPLVSFLLQTDAETDAHVHLARSTDGGLTFPTSTSASAPADGGQTCECCYQDILATGGDTVLVAFRANRNNLRDMWVTRSTNGGASFDVAVDVDDQNWVINACPFSGPRIARLAGDSLVAVWMSKGGGPTRVFASTWHGATMLKGSEFGLPGSSGAATFSQNHPDVAGKQDTIAMVWEESGFVGTGQDLVCAYSATGAGGLAANVANLPQAAAQKFPQLAYQAGVFHLLFVTGSQGMAYRRADVVAPSQVDAIALTSNQVRLSPNPVGEFLLLESKAALGTVEIFLASGQLVRVASVRQGRIDLTGLPAGSYVLKIRDHLGGLLEVQKLIKQ